MKLSFLCVILICGLALQTNETDAIFWQFLRPFINVTVSTTSTSSNSSSSSSGSTGSSGTNVSTGALNNSNIIVASNSSVSANISQNFPSGSCSSSDTTATTTGSSDTTTTTAAAESTTEAMTTTTEAMTTTT